MPPPPPPSPALAHVAPLVAPGLQRGTEEVDVHVGVHLLQRNDARGAGKELVDVEGMPSPLDQVRGVAVRVHPILVVAFAVPRSFLVREDIVPRDAQGGAVGRAAGRAVASL